MVGDRLSDRLPPPRSYGQRCEPDRDHNEHCARPAKPTSVRLGIQAASRSITDDGDFCFGNFQANQAVVVVEQEEDFQVRRADFEAFISFALGTR